MRTRGRGRPRLGRREGSPSPRPVPRLRTVLHPGLAGRVAEAFDLGGDAVLVGPVATGRLGRIWRLTTDCGRYAVKDSQLPIDPTEVARDAAYQDVVRAHDISMPAVV